jgi:hypothetical protein
MSRLAAPPRMRLPVLLLISKVPTPVRVTSPLILRSAAWPVEASASVPALVIVPMSVVKVLSTPTNLLPLEIVTPLRVAACCTAPPLGVVMTPVPAVVRVPPRIVTPSISCTVEPSWASMMPSVLVKLPPLAPVSCKVALLVARNVPVLIIPVAFGLITSSVG